MLQEHSMLVHVGPHKTGSTALQLALKRLDGEDARAAGVEYITSGKRENANIATLALGQTASVRNVAAAPFPHRYWDDFAQRVNISAAPRVMVSSEELALLSVEGVKRYVKTFSGRKLHILLALRPISELLPSQWQQRVQRGRVTRSFDAWLEETLNEWGQGSQQNNFWYRHHYGELIKRWGDLVGLSEITAVVLNKSDRARTFRVTEQLLGIRTGALANGREFNRSLTLEESESLRSMYLAFEQQGLDDLTGHLRAALSPALFIKRSRMPHGSERKILLPRHAVKRVLEIQRDLVDPLDSLGINVIGDLNLLRSVDNVLEVNHQANETATVPVDLVGWVAAGVIHASGLAKGRVLPASKQKIPISYPEVWLRHATGRQLIRELQRRLTARFGIRTKSRD